MNKGCLKGLLLNDQQEAALLYGEERSLLCLEAPNV